MNRLYKVVFNKARGQYVVCGEHSKTHTKSKALKAVIASVLTMGALAMVTQAAASPGPYTGTYTGTQYYEYGYSPDGSGTVALPSNNVWLKVTTQTGNPDGYKSIDSSATAVGALRLDGNNGDSGIDFQKLTLKIEALKKDSTDSASNKQVYGVYQQNGAVTYNGSTKITAETDFYGTGSSALALYSAYGGTSTFNGDLILEGTSTNENGKSVYGLVASGYWIDTGGDRAIAYGAPNYPTINLNGEKVDINLKTATVRDGTYSEAIGIDVASKGVVNSSANTTLKISLSSQTEALTQSTTGAYTGNQYGSSPLTGIKAEGGKVGLKGKTEIDIRGGGANTYGIWVTNGYYTSTTGSVSEDSAVTTANTIITTESKAGKSFGILTQQFPNASAEDVTFHATGKTNISALTESGGATGLESGVGIMQFDGETNVNAEATSGSAVGLNILSDSTVDFNANATITASAGESGTANGVTNSGKMNVNAGTTIVNGGMKLLDGGQIKVASDAVLVGAIDSVESSSISLANTSQLNINGNSTINGKIDSSGGNIALDKGAKLNINQLTNTDKVTTLTLNSGDANQVTIAKMVNAGSETEGSLSVNLTKNAADELSGSTAAAKAQSATGVIGITNGDKGYQLNIAEGDIMGAVSATVNNEGLVASSVKETKNQTMQSLTELGFDGFQTFRAQMNDLDKRMGDLRTMPQASGAWARAFAGQSKYKSTHSNYKTLQAGVDYRMGNFFGGVMASYTDGDGSVKMGDTDDKNYSFGLYGGWLADNGQFIDITIKRHHLESDYDLRYRNGDKSKGSYHTAGTSISAEYGWRLPITNTNFYVEPQVEFMYGHLNSVGYTTSNGVKVNQSAGKTAVGRLGAAFGYVSPDKSGSAYIKASVLNDWEGDMKTRASKGAVSRYYHDDMGGTWGEFAIGGTYNLSKDWSIYGEAETTAGNPVRTTYQFSAGVRYSF